MLNVERRSSRLSISFDAFDVELMEQYLRQRIDCPIPGGTRALIEEKDDIIKKQQDELHKLQLQIQKIQIERDYIISLLSDEQKSSMKPV